MICAQVRVLVNDHLEPDTAEIVTLASLFNKCVLPLSQVISMSMRDISISGIADGDGGGESEGTYTTSKQWTRGTVTTSGVKIGRKEDIESHLSILCRIL